MKRRNFFATAVAAVLAPFGVKAKPVEYAYRDEGWNLIVYNKRRPDWKPPEWKKICEHDWDVVTCVCRKCRITKYTALSQRNPK